MELKVVTIEGVTYAAVQDGKPVYVDGAREIAFDAVGTRDTITRLNGEAKGHREAKEAAEARLRTFDGITDAAAAMKALETVGKLDQKQLIDAGQVDTVKAEITKAYEEKLTAAEARAKALEESLYGEKVGGSFARSQFIAERLAIPADFAEARFGKNFKVVDGKVVAVDATGNQIYSRAKPGELANFDEALEFLVDAYPQKDLILKGDIKAGGGANQPGTITGNKTMKQAAFDALPPKERAAKMAEGYTLQP